MDRQTQLYQPLCEVIKANPGIRIITVLQM